MELDLDEIIPQLHLPESPDFNIAPKIELDLNRTCIELPAGVNHCPESAPTVAAVSGESKRDRDTQPRELRVCVMIIPADRASDSDVGSVPVVRPHTGIVIGSLSSL